MFGNKLHSLLKTLIVSLVLASPAAVKESAANEETPHLNFVSFIDPPYIFDKKETDSKGLIEIVLDKLMQDIGISYSIKLLPAKRAEMAARDNKNTCILPIEKSQEREVFFSWVSPLIVSKHGFFSMPSNADITLNTLNDAYPFRIGSYLGSGIGDYLNSFKYKVDYAAQNDANIHKLKLNRIDLWASDILSAQHISKQSGIEITPSKLDFFTTLRAIGCHLDVSKKTITDMQDKLQKMYRDGTIYSIVQQFKADNYNGHQ